MFELFTDSARRVVVYAQEESRLLDHDHVGTEHVLLGLLHDSDGDTALALGRAGVELVAVQQRLEQSHGRGKREPSGHVPFTARAKKVMHSALRVSQRLGGDTIGSPHLLRAMLDVPDSTGYALLVGLEVDIDALARVSDDLARSSTESRREDGGADVWVRRGSAEELAQRLDRLATGLRQYGRHLDSCARDSGRGCTCGLVELLADAEPQAEGEGPGIG